MKQHLTSAAACGMLGITRNTLINWCDAGKLKHYVTPGGHRRIELSAVEELLGKKSTDNKVDPKSKLSDPCNAAFLAELKRRIKEEKGFAQELLTSAGILGEDGQLAPEYRSPPNISNLTTYPKLVSYGSPHAANVEATKSYRIPNGVRLLPSNIIIDIRELHRYGLTISKDELDNYSLLKKGPLGEELEKFEFVY
jgi:excisionase family DNA binding protein